MKFGKKLAIIGLIIFGIGVPSTATTMSSPLFDLPHRMQQSATIDGIVIFPDETKNIKHTLRGSNPILVSFEVDPQKSPYSAIVRNYQWSHEVLNVVESGSSEYKIEYARPGTYDFDFVNIGDEDLYITIEIRDARYDEISNLHENLIPLMIYIYYAVFFGGMIVGGIGVLMWRVRK